MKGNIGVEFSFESGADQLFISSNVGAKPRDKKCLRPLRFRDDRQGLRAANTDEGLSVRFNLVDSSNFSRGIAAGSLLSVRNGLKSVRIM
jgi:hypothetical protein